MGFSLDTASAHRVLDAGLLELTAKATAPTLTGGWVRFYKRFLVRVPLPRWSSLSDGDRNGLAEEGERFDAAFNGLFGFLPGKLFP